MNGNAHRLRAERNDGFQIIYVYQGEALWKSETEVSIPIKRRGVPGYKKQTATLKLKDVKSCSELDTNETNIVLRRNPIQ